MAAIAEITVRDGRQEGFRVIHGGTTVDAQVDALVTCQGGVQSVKWVDADEVAVTLRDGAVVVFYLCDAEG